MPSIKQAVCPKGSISLDDICSLITISYTSDEDKQQVATETERQIFCTRTSVHRAEANSGAKNGLKPAMTLLVDSDEYDGESKVKYGETIYSIHRNFRRDDGFTELHCEVRKNGN